MYRSAAILDAIDRIPPINVRNYATARGWALRPLPRRRFWLLNRPEEDDLRQLQVPMDRDAVDFRDAMLVSLERIAEQEDRRLEVVLSDVLTADSDVIRVRVSHPDSGTGQLSMNDDVALRRGLKRAIAAAASSVVNPVKHHPKMSRSNAVELLGKCRAGQTERGSYVIKVACPLFAVEENTDHHRPPFTRQTSILLMTAVSGLVDAIEQSTLDQFLEADKAIPKVSSNLCDALVQMHPDRERGDLEITTSWASDPTVDAPGPDVPERAVIKSDYLHEIERVGSSLRPYTDEKQIETFAARVEALNGELDADRRRAGDVTLALLHPDGERITARANLDHDQYAVALQAHEAFDLFVSLRGRLSRGPRVSSLDRIEFFELIQAPRSTPERE